MMKFDIENNTILGYSHSGSVVADAVGVLELEDEEVSLLVDLIKENGTSDVDDLELEDEYPELYEKLNEAYYNTAYRALELHWLWEGYKSQCFDYDINELKSYCKENCGFVFEYDEAEYTDDDGNLDKDYLEEDENEAFETWLDGYVESLSDDEVCDFFYSHMNADPNIDDVSYDVEIPQPIIDMAKEA